MLLFTCNAKAVLSWWKPRDATVKFDTYRNLQRHRAVLPAIARLLVWVIKVSCGIFHNIGLTSVKERLRFAVVWSWSLYCKVTVECVSERILTTGQYSAKDETWRLTFQGPLYPVYKPNSSLIVDYQHRSATWFELCTQVFEDDNPPSHCKPLLVMFM